MSRHWPPGLWSYGEYYPYGWFYHYYKPYGGTPFYWCDLRSKHWYRTMRWVRWNEERWLFLRSVVSLFAWEDKNR